MAEKTSFSSLVSSPPNIKPDQKACLNCIHSRPPTEPTPTKPYVMCRKGPPSVLIEPVPTQQTLAIRNRWPAMALDEECDAFESKFSTRDT